MSHSVYWGLGSNGVIFRRRLHGMSEVVCTRLLELCYQSSSVVLRLGAHEYRA
ncbi:hypothetical protein [Xenorhabdus bovienii]|uniref:hypothetical protein n=1 Tax=Xenorhabdus bovienii TaxID=40576 RepID=UPI0023B264B5|nr:hypothetical protein [Xenorhabdus bovienii]MDE9459685.1 hypothetical protein [Xenorhabdus bovienii]MDE9488033.1 hypothetical protein [Xenorhabdus bovienii]MDE9516004.1 hypothetical protein [Xenorhabdus bovienii]